MYLSKNPSKTHRIWIKKNSILNQSELSFVFSKWRKKIWNFGIFLQKAAHFELCLERSCIHSHTIKSRYFGQLCNCVDINVLLTLVCFLTHLNTRTYTHMYLVHNCLFFFFSRSLFFVSRRSCCLNFENRS